MNRSAESAIWVKPSFGLEEIRMFAPLLPVAASMYTLLMTSLPLYTHMPRMPVEMPAR